MNNTKILAHACEPLYSSAHQNQYEEKNAMYTMYMHKIKKQKYEFFLFLYIYTVCHIQIK